MKTIPFRYIANGNPVFVTLLAVLEVFMHRLPIYGSSVPTRLPTGAAEGRKLAANGYVALLLLPPL